MTTSWTSVLAISHNPPLSKDRNESRVVSAIYTPPLKMTSNDSPPSEKADLAHDESGTDQPHRHGHHSKGQDEIERIDAIALAQGTTMDSFKHLDEKKILRKMDVRLIPVLALLYLLSFLDRKS